MPPTSNLRLRFRSDGLGEIPPTGDIMVKAVQLGDDGFHKDPMDRIIVATALQTGCSLATADTQILIWAERTGQLSILTLPSSLRPSLSLRLKKVAARLLGVDLSGRALTRTEFFVLPEWCLLWGVL